MPADTAVQVYKGFASLEKPVYIWTPDGGYNAPKLIAEAKTPTGMDMPDTISFLRSQNPRQRQLTSAEWYRVREALEASKLDIENSMITGAYESTSTLVDFDHGIVIQIPDIDAEGNLVTDEKGIIKGRHSWEMALPTKSDYVKNLIKKDCKPFCKMLYGMEDIEKLPDYAYFYIDDNPTGIRNMLRGHWDYVPRERRRVDVLGRWRPSDSYESVASRGAVDNVKLVNRLNNDEYASQLEGLIRKAKQATPEQAADFISQINEHLKGALVWEDI